jgi:hypothetical protein
MLQIAHRQRAIRSHRSRVTSLCVKSAVYVDRHDVDQKEEIKLGSHTLRRVIGMIEAYM